MAWSMVSTEIQNPAGRGRGKSMAKKMSAKQIRFFGTKRQRAALKASRTRKRHAPAAKRSNSGSTSRPRKKLAHKTLVSQRRHSQRKTNSSHRQRRKKNPELVSFLLGNPARRRKTKVAHSSKSKKRAASRSNAGTRRRPTTSRPVHHRRRSNPGMGAIGNPKAWVMGGAGVLAGFMGSAALPQMLLGASNTGVTGYAATAAAAIGLGLLSHFLLPRQPAVTAGVIGGGIANLLRRVISDQTPFGGYLSNTGMGDYMVANWGPPRMSDGLHSAMAESIGAPWGGGGSITASSGVSMQDLSDMRATRPC